MDSLALIATLAMLVERLTAYLKQVGIGGVVNVGTVSFPVPVLVSVVLGELCAFGANLDLLGKMGVVVTNPTLTIALTGLVIAGGAQLANNVGSAFRAQGSAPDLGSGKTVKS